MLNTLILGLEDEDGVEPVEFVGNYSIDAGVADLVQHITAALDFNLAAFREQRTVSDAFSYLRARAEDAGVFVLLVGDLGSHHTAISTDTFRGYALADPIAPFLVINDRDARSAWSFTLLHELCHVFTGYSGVSGGYAEVAVERVCNDVASGILLPEDELDELASGPADIEAISGFAEERNLSRTMVAYRLFRRGRLPREAWLALQHHFTTEWFDYRDEMRARGREQEGGPTYYVVRRHRLGPGLLGTVAYLLKSGSLTTVKAGKVLGVKPKNVAEVLSGTSSAISV